MIRRERPCPRVELVEENVAIMPMVRAVMNESTRSLAPLVAEVLLPTTNRGASLLRILSAVQSKRVNDAIEEGRKRRIEAAKTQRP